MKRKAISKAVKKEVWDKCGGRCWYCGSRIIRPFFHFDHVHPHSKGGKDTSENLVVACIPCNMSKKNTSVTFWRVNLQRKMGLAMPDYQVKLLKSEGINVADDPYIWEPVLLFFFERNLSKQRIFGDSKYGQIVRFKGWSE
jgi:hypothetical protein